LHYCNFVISQAHVVISASCVVLYCLELAVHATAGCFFWDLKAFHWAFRMCRNLLATVQNWSFWLPSVCPCHTSNNPNFLLLIRFWSQDTV